MNKYFASLAIAVVLSVAISAVVLRQPARLGGTVENFPTLWSNGLRIGNLSGNANGNTLVTNIQCVAKSFALASALTANSTTTFDVALTGASVSSNQAYFVGIATTTASLVQATVNPTSTAGFVSVLLRNLGGASFGTSTTNYSVCLLQF